jgi:single-strand DNA-binding protein
MNSINITGRITTKPELKFTGNEKKAVVSFSIAFNRGEEQVDFFNVVAYEKQAENLCKFVDKGDMLAISGRLTSRSYTNKENQQVNVVEIIASNITFITKKD